MLLFKKKYLDAIRTGRKTQTVRVWKQRYLRPGQISYIPGVGRIRITAVDEVQLEELNNEDGIRDGFASAEELVAEIRRLYPERLQMGYRVFRIAFELPAAGQAQPSQQESPPHQGAEDIKKNSP